MPFADGNNFKSCIVNRLQQRIVRFLPHNAMHSADYAIARCLSVCLHGPVLWQNVLTYRPNCFSAW